LRERLPKEVAALLSGAMPAKAPATFIRDWRLEKRTNDGVFLDRLTTREQIITVLEHKSFRDAEVGPQLKGTWTTH
jgi:hypothetical protein